MPTLKPRITITLQPAAYEVLSRLSMHSGDSMSKIVVSFVDIAIPSLERVAAILERAKAAPDEVRAGMAAAIERAERQAIPVMRTAMGQMDAVLDDLSSAAGVSGGGGRKSTPVPVTRGSGPAGPANAPRGGGRKGRHGQI